jgi:hypothetical protein
VIDGNASTLVAATPEQVISFVLDLHRYREADHKIVKVKSVHGDNPEGGSAFHRGAPRGLDPRGPADVPSGRTVAASSSEASHPGGRAGSQRSTAS